ncbi:hypothetical protein PI124_g12648 [Phytophthora idaei]|nr:hypothetical protein PI124_g12648 [Phytophthora idaei]
MVVESVASASTTTPHALLLCPLVGWNQGSTFLVTKTIALMTRFLFLLGFLIQLLFAPNTIALSYSFAVFLGDLPSAPLDQRDRGHTQIVELNGHVAARFLYVERGLAEKMSSWRVWREFSLSCPSTFLLRSGHGCAPPSSLFSVALAPLPLKSLQASNSL